MPWTEQAAELAPLVAVAAALVATLLVLERRRPLRRPTLPVRIRLLANAVLTACALGAAALAVSPVVDAMSRWAPEAGVGVLPMLGLPAWAQVALGFFLLDLSFYYWHRANHEVPLLWRFHVVHHIDPDLDVTTALRFHPAEVLLSSGFRALQLVVIGAPLWLVASYEAVFQAETLFHHSNVRLPVRFERALLLLMVSPRMHGVHHSRKRAETNSNYSVVFSLWDRLHRTLRLDVPDDAVTIGVPGYARPGDNHPVAALLQPFRKQRPYWPREEGRPRMDAGAGAE